MHRKFEDIGREIFWSWGQDDRGDYKSLIDKMGDSRMLVCLLTYVIERLRLSESSITVSNSILNKIANFNVKLARQNESHPVSDGIMTALGMSRGNAVIPDDLSCLSARARKAIKRAGIKYLSEITRDRLTGIRQCGETTITELTLWADQLQAQ